MNTHSKSNVLLALVLAISVAATGCSAQWINIALQDLPVLTQMALNVATLVSTLAAGKQAGAADLAVLQNISAQAMRDLNLLQTLTATIKRIRAEPNYRRFRTSFPISIRICQLCWSRHKFRMPCCRRESLPP